MRDAHPNKRMLVQSRLVDKKHDTFTSAVAYCVQFTNTVCPFCTSLTSRTIRMTTLDGNNDGGQCHYQFSASVP